MESIGDGVRAFQRWHDTLKTAECGERVESIFVSYRHILGPVNALQVGMLRPDARVIEPRRDGVGSPDLAFGGLEELAHRTVQDAFAAGAEGGGVVRRIEAPAGRFDADELHVFVFEEGVEEPDGVAAAADAGQRVVGQTSLLFAASALSLRGR